MNIQYGCGLCAPESWTNFDSSPTLRIQRLPFLGTLFCGKDKSPLFPNNVRFGNIVSGLPIENGQADLVYCSHVLEHLALDEFRSALLQTHRILKSGGTFRFVLPDLAYAIQEYLANPPAIRAILFLESTMLGMRNRNRGFNQIVRDCFGGSKHHWMWDYEGIEKELKDANFIKIRRAEFSDSAISDFTEVEDAARWANALGVECQKL